jgi:hypothetical protein
MLSVNDRLMIAFYFYRQRASYSEIIDLAISVQSYWAVIFWVLLVVDFFIAGLEL